MAKSRSIDRLVGVAVLLLVGVASALAQDGAATDGPLDRIRRSNTEILARFGADDTLSVEAEVEVYEIMDAVTDFEAMTAAAVGDLCEGIAEHKCDEWKVTFRELLRVSSLKRLGRYRADRFDYAGETIEGTTALVETIAWYEGESYPLDYQMKLEAGEWRIVDYVFDGIDTVTNYRRQFTRLLERESVDDIIGHLRTSIEKYSAGTGPGQPNGVRVVPSRFLLRAP